MKAILQSIFEQPTKGIRYTTAYIFTFAIFIACLLHYSVFGLIHLQREPIVDLIKEYAVIVHNEIEEPVEIDITTLTAPLNKEPEIKEPITPEKPPEYIPPLPVNSPPKIKKAKNTIPDNNTIQNKTDLSQVGKALTTKSSESSTLNDEKIFTIPSNDNAENPYAGGASHAQGENKQALSADKVQAGDYNDLSRPIQNLKRNWRCPWPKADLDIFKHTQWIKIVVDQKGSITKITAPYEHNLNSIFFPVAKNCALKQKFKPALNKQGQPIVSSPTLVKVDFTK